MTITIQPGVLKGTVHRVMPSKSQAHRALICAAQAETETRITDIPPSEDIQATIRCLRALGAEIREEDGVLLIRRFGCGGTGTENAEMDCGESGSTLRFLLPLAAAMGLRGSFTGHGKLPSRPLSPMYEEMITHGAELSPQGQFPLTVSGQLQPGTYRMAGNVSSQFISGLAMALPGLPGDSRIEISGRMESRPYVDLTMQTLRDFGIRIDEAEKTLIIYGGQHFLSPGRIRVESDWSGAAFWLAAGALSMEGVTCEGMNPASAQGDRAMVRLLREFGAEVTEDGETVTVRKAPLKGIEIDAADIPDLVPVLAVTAAYAEGETVIRNIRRLRMKESDRVVSVLTLIRSLGGTGDAEENEMRISGRGGLRGGEADAFRDHRIAMAAAIAATAAEKAVNLTGAEAVSKSYPGFFEQMKALGGRTEQR